jgi:hypothetical protein
MNTKQYHYVVRQTAEARLAGRVCVLTADVDRVAAATGGESCGGGAVIADRLLSAREMFALQQAVEPGALIEVSDARVTELNAVASWAAIYRGADFERCQAAGMGATEAPTVAEELRGADELSAQACETAATA